MTLTESTQPKSKRRVKKDTTRSCPQKAIVLLDWIIRPLPDIRGVCVEGQKQGTQNFWHSTAIVDVLNPKLVVTVTGSWYRLRGRINKLCAIDNGFSKNVVQAFARGFPKNWKQIIQEFYSQLEDSISILENCSPLLSKKVPELVSEKKRRKPSPIASSKKLKLTPAPQEPHTILTPQGIMKQKISRDDVTVTRSGRVSLPPLAGWTGQHYRKIPESNEIEITFDTDCAKNFLNQMTTEFLQLPKSSLRMMGYNNKMLSKSFQLPTSTAPKVDKQKTNKTLEDLDGAADISPPAVFCEEAHKKTHRVKEGTDYRSVVVQDLHVSEVINKDMRVILCHVPDCDVKGSSRQNQKQVSHGQVTSYVSDNLQGAESCNNQSFCSTVVQSASCGKAALLQKSSNSNIKTQADKQLSHRDSHSHSVQLQITNSHRKKSKEKPENIKTPPMRKSGCTSQPSTDNPSVRQSRSGRWQQCLSQTQKVIPSAAGVKVSTKQRERERKRKQLDDDDDVRDKASKRRKLKQSSSTDKDVSWSHKVLQRALTEVNGEIVGTKVDTLDRKLSEKQLTKESVIQVESDSKSKKTNGRQKGRPILGGKGTLKRKQELREFLEEQNDGYEDNIFDSTPFASRKMASSVFAVNVDQDDSEIFGGNHSCITPGLKSTPGTLPRAKMASLRKTPAHIRLDDTPVSINRRKTDKYIKTFIDRQRKAGAGTSVPQVESSLLELSTLPVKSLFSPINIPSIVVDDDDEDDHNGAEISPYMYYWNSDKLDS